jgi:hypothetical protein
VVWMRCASESLRSLSANTRLRGLGNPHLLDQYRLLPLDPHIRQRDGLPPNLPRPSPYRGIDPSPPLQPKKPCGTSFPSRPVYDFAVLLPRPVLTAVLSPLCFFSSLSLSRVWVASVRPAVVLFYDPALFVLRLICPLLCFMPDDGTHQPHLYLIISIHPSLWISTRVCVSLPSLPRCCVFGLSCSRSYRMCILFFRL